MTSSVEILTAATRQPIKRNGPVRHLPAAQWLHWATAALITLLVTAGVLMTQLGEGQAADLLFILHKTAGAAAFVLVLTRLAYRLAKRLSGRWHAHSGAH